MVSEPRVPAAPLTGLHAGLVKLASKRMLGDVPESLSVTWQYPAVPKAMMSFGRKADKWDQLDPNLATFAAMSAAATIGCRFCLDLHYFMAHNRKLDEAKAREVPRWRDSELFSARERLVLEYAEAMSTTPPSVTDEMSAALLKELGAAALVELAARVAAMNMTARANVALGVHSGGFAEACGLRPLATAPPHATRAA